MNLKIDNEHNLWHMLIIINIFKKSIKKNTFVKNINIDKKNSPEF